MPLAGAFIIVCLKTFWNACDLSKGCYCFELFGDMALRMDTGQCQLLAPGRSWDHGTSPRGAAPGRVWEAVVNSLN